MSAHLELAKAGENEARIFLVQKGMKILHTNWRYWNYELDIIALHKENVVFVEVKTRANDYFQQPFDAVNRKKRRNMVEAANAYIEKYKLDMEARFDVMSILIDGKQTRIEHIEDAFYPSVK